eukprot:366436-Chlamydomonas_euryale.AAC.3
MRIGHWTPMVIFVSVLQTRVSVSYAWEPTPPADSFVTNVTIPGLAAYYALLVSQVPGYKAAHSASP